jgi:Rrf2 family nitric oxide-sensitive transcriptional repressor
VQLTSHTDYALRLLIYLMARPGQCVSTREIAEHYGVSVNHLVKVAKALTHEGWLVASRGVGGGVTLAPHTPEVKVGDIVRRLENTDLVECFQAGTNTCPIARCCKLKPMLHQARDAFLTVLDSFLVKDMTLRALGLSPGGKRSKKVIASKR